MRKPYRIMTFDGGGICGTYSIVLLRRLLQCRPQLIDQVDLFAGTSTGGIIALCLASGLSVDTIVDLYKNRGKDIFERSMWRKLTSPFGLRESKYDNAGLIKACYDVLGNTVLGDLKRNVVVPAFNLKNEVSTDDPGWRMQFFHNLDADCRDEKIADVAIRTSSAPTFFPSYQGYVDGGMACNDPSVLAIAEAVENGDLDLSDIRLLSIGTGGQIKYLDGADLQWGALKWLGPILNIFMGGQSLVADSISTKLLGGNYCRLSPIIPDIAMDDVAKVGELIDLANAADLTVPLKFLDEHFLV